MPRHHIGVAVGLPARESDELQTWRERLGDPNADRIVPHVTLLPPTLVGADRLDAVHAHLSAVAARHRGFTIHLRGTATFRPVSPVVFVPLVAGISQCELLEADVRSGPLARTTKFPYHPHVTVAHDLDEAGLDRAYEALAHYEARFPVGGFALYEEGRDKVWRPLVEFAFPDAPDAPEAPDAPGAPGAPGAPDAPGAGGGGVSAAPSG